MGFSDGSVVKKPPAMQEMWVPSLGREEPLEKKIATHFSVPAWEIPWTEEPGRLQSMGFLKEISPGCSLEGLMLKLKLQYLGHLMQRTDSFEELTH